MGVGIRHYLFPETGEPLKLSQRLAEGLARGDDALPQFAGTRQRVLSIVLEFEEGGPTGIIRYDGSVWAFDENGTITKSLRESFAEVMEFAFPPPDSGNVIAISSKIKKRHHDERHRWVPTDEDIARILADIRRLPGTKALKSAKGVNKRPPPLTHQARHILDQVEGHFFQIEYPLRALNEQGLKGLAYEARRRAAEESTELYSAVAEIAEDKLRLITRRKSAKGLWYALVEVYELEREGVASVLATFHRACDGREAAEAAARELLSVHGDKLSADRRLEASVETDLEWEAAARWSTES